MQQSNFIFGVLAVAFIVFVTTRGNLPKYIAILTGNSASGSDTKSDTSKGPTAGSALGDTLFGDRKMWNIPGIGPFPLF